MVTVTVCYRPGIDLAYYLTKHVPMSEEIMIPLGVLQSEVRRYDATPAGTPAPYAVMTTLTFPSLAVFQATMGHPAMAKLFADVPNFYPHGEPEVWIGEVVQKVEYPPGSARID